MQQSDASRETELQNLLSDERNRCNQYKHIYQVLKEKHSSLQKELSEIHQQLREALERSNQIKGSNDQYIQKLEQIVKEKQNEINELKEKLSSYNPNEIKEKALSEASTYYEDAVQHVQKEADKYREQYNHLHYEHTVLKCQLEYIESENARVVELMKIQHTAEVEELKSIVETLEQEKKGPVKDYSVELRNAEKEIIQLNSRLKIVLGECEELRAQNERALIQTDTLSRNHAKQISEYTTNARELESEKSDVMMQKDVIQKELVNCTEQKNSLSDQLQQSKQEILILKSQLDDLKHKYELRISNLQIESQQFKGRQDAEIEELNNEISRLKLEIAHLNDEARKHQQTCEEKVITLQLNLQTAKQEFWKEYTEIKKEKENLELNVKKLEIMKNETITQLQQELKKVKHEVLLLSEAKQETEKKLFLMTNQIRESSQKIDSALYDDLAKQNVELKTEIQHLKANVVNLTSKNVGNPQMGKDLTGSATCFEKHDGTHEKEYQELIHLRLNMEQQKHQFQQRITELETYLKDKQTEWNNDKKEMQNKIKLYSRLITKIRGKLDVQNAKLEEFEVEKEILKDNIPVEEHLKLKKQLTELQRKQEEFHQVMAAVSQFAFTANNGEFQMGKKTPLSAFQIPLVEKEFSNLNSKFGIDQLESTKLSSGIRRRTSRKSKLKSTRRTHSPNSSSSDIENL